MPRPFEETLSELNAGVYIKQVEEMLRQVAVGVANHGQGGRKGRLVLTLGLTQNKQHEDMLDLEYGWAFEYPTKRGKKSETNAMLDPVYVAFDGTVSTTPIVVEQNKLSVVTNIKGGE